MSYFKRIALLKGRQRIEPPNETYASDLTELCHLGAFIENDVDIVSIPVGPYHKNPYKAFAKSLKKYRFDFLGISLMTGGYHSAMEYARLAKEAGVYVAAGGYHPTALPGEVLSSPDVDAVVRGEGELTLRELIVHGPGKDLLGLSYKDRGETIHNPDRPLIMDLDTLPQPLRKIRPTRFGERGDQYSIDTLYSSRGCIARCTFCANDTVNGSFRPRSPEHFVEELELLHDKHHKKTVKFWDSIFLFDPKRVEKIVELMLRKNLTHFRIITESRSDDVIRCRHLMPELKRIGFEKIQIGIESPDPETFRRLRKGGSIAKHEEAIRIVQKNKMKVEGFFIIGHPHETEEDIKRYPEFAARLGINQRALYFVMTPYPGTQVYREYKEKKLIDSYDWSRYNNFGAVVRLDKLSRRRLRNLLGHCYGSTAGISYAFEREKTLPRMAGLIFSFTLIWLFLFDIQGAAGKEARNRFVGSLLEAGFGSYRKKRTTNALSKVLRRFVQTVDIRFILDEEKSVLFSFALGKDEIGLEVRPTNPGEKRRITVTMDDIVFIYAGLDMVDLNALMFLSHKPSRSFEKIFYCIPTLFRTAKTLIKLARTLGWRFLFYSKA